MAPSHPLVRSKPEPIFRVNWSDVRTYGCTYVRLYLRAMTLTRYSGWGPAGAVWEAPHVLSVLGPGVRTTTTGTTTTTITHPDGTTISTTTTTTA